MVVGAAVPVGVGVAVPMVPSPGVGVGVRVGRGGFGPGVGVGSSGGRSVENCVGIVTTPHAERERTEMSYSEPATGLAIVTDVAVWSFE